MRTRNITQDILFITLSLLEIIISIPQVYYYGIRVLGRDMRCEPVGEYDRLLEGHSHYIIHNMKEIYRITRDILTNNIEIKNIF